MQRSRQQYSGTEGARDGSENGLLLLIAALTLATILFPGSASATLSPQCTFAERDHVFFTGSSWIDEANEALLCHGLPNVVPNPRAPGRVLDDYKAGNEPSAVCSIIEHDAPCGPFPESFNAFFITCPNACVSRYIGGPIGLQDLYCTDGAPAITGTFSGTCQADGTCASTATCLSGATCSSSSNSSFVAFTSGSCQAGDFHSQSVGSTTFTTFGPP